MNRTTLSDKAHAVIAHERSAVVDRLAQLQRQSEALHVLIAEVDAELQSAERLLRQMDEILGLEPQLPLDTVNEELRGRRLREIAVQVLRAQQGEGTIIHYTDWFKLVTQAGVKVGGKNPVATFLTQISQAVGVESVRPRSGLYRLVAA